MLYGIPACQNCREILKITEGTFYLSLLSRVYTHVTYVFVVERLILSSFSLKKVSRVH